MWTKMGPSLIIEAPPPPGPHIAKDVNVFTYEKLIICCFSLLYLCLQCDEVFMTLSASVFNIRFPRTPPPQIKKKLITNFHQITSIFYMLLEDSFGLKFISKFSWGLEAYMYIKTCLWVLLTHVYWFRATGGYICGCGRPSNLVYYLHVIL